MKIISSYNTTEKWYSLIISIFFLIVMMLTLDFFSFHFFFFIFIFYLIWMQITFYSILISSKKIILKNSILFKEFIYTKKDFDFFERNSCSQSVYRIGFKNNKKYYFHILATRYSGINPFGFTKRKDKNMIYWEQFINEIED